MNTKIIAGEKIIIISLIQSVSILSIVYQENPEGNLPS